MAKKLISVRIEESLLEGLDKLMPNSMIYNSLTSKIEGLLGMNIVNYNYALKSLTNKFSYLEVCYMAQAFNGTIIQRNILNTAKYLLMEVSDFYEFGSMGFISDEELDVESLLNKLNGLSDYQALVVINCIEEFWKGSNNIDIRDLPIVAK